jgi:hypothetical protein
MLEPIPRQPALSAATGAADGHDSGAEDAGSEDTDHQEQQQQEQEQRSAALVLPHNMKKLFWKV